MPNKLKTAARWLRHRGSLLVAPLSVGVRAMVQDADGALLLVRHTYAPGWHFPGGGVAPGETAFEALNRELVEETGLRLDTPGELAGVFLNRSLSNRDHVLLFKCARWQRIRQFQPNFEIAEARFFAVAELPADISRGTKRRLDEIANDTERSSYW